MSKQKNLEMDDIECEFSVQHLQDDDYAQGLICEISELRKQAAEIEDLEGNRQSLRRMFDARKKECNDLKIIIRNIEEGKTKCEDTYIVTIEAQKVEIAELKAKIESMRESLEMVKPIIEGLDLTHRSSETCEMLNAVYRAIKEEG